MTRVFFGIVSAFLFSTSASAHSIQAGMGAGANSAYSYFLKGKINNSKSSRMVLRYLETGSSTSASREGRVGGYWKTSSSVETGGDIFYRSEPDSLSVVGLSPSVDFELDESTHLGGGLDLASYSQPLGGSSGGGKGSSKARFSMASVGLNLTVDHDFGDFLHSYLSAAFYRYSTPTQGASFSKRRTPLFTDPLTQLGTFPESEWSGGFTYDLTMVWDATLGASRSQDASTKVITVSEWLATSYQVSSQVSGELQYTQSNTGTRFYEITGTFRF